MRHRPPPPIPGIAPHIPAEIYRQAQREGRPIVVVHTTVPAPRSARTYLMPLAVGMAGALGAMGTIAAALALFQFAVHTAALVAGAIGPIGIGSGITLRLARK